MSSSTRDEMGSWVRGTKRMTSTNWRRPHWLMTWALGLAVLASSSAQAAVIVDVVGDMDDFGFAPNPRPPARAFFNNNDGAPDDMPGNFDEAASGTGTLVHIYTHDFTGDPAFGPGFVATSVTLEIPELYGNPGNAPTISIDGNVFSFLQTGTNSTTDVEVDVQTFTFSGAAAAFANDGIVNIQIARNGDFIAIDYSMLTITGAAVPEPSSLILLGLASTGTLAWRRRRRKNLVNA